MHAGTFHRAECFNGAGKLTFQRTLVVHLLAELADTEFFLIQQLKANGTALRQTLLCQTQAQLMHLICRNLQRAAVIGKAIGDVHLGQLGDDGAAILIGKVAVERPVVRAFRPQNHRYKDRNCGSACHDQRDFRIRAKAVHPLE